MKNVIGKIAITILIAMTFFLCSCTAEVGLTDSQIDEAMEVLAATATGNTQAARTTVDGGAGVPVIEEIPGNSYEYSFTESELYIKMTCNYTTKYNNISYKLSGPINITLPIDGQNYIQLKTTADEPFSIVGGELDGNLIIDLNYNHELDPVNNLYVFTCTGTINGETYIDRPGSFFHM